MNSRAIAHTFKSPLLLASVLTSVLTSSAWAMNEQEENNPLDSAQNLEATSSVIDVNGVLGTIGGGNVDDLDFFTFYGKEGDVVTLDIDGGSGGAQSVDTIIAVFGPDQRVLRMNDDAAVDEGSSSASDSRIENFRLPADGMYSVGVSNYPRYFRNGGTVYYARYVSNGDYELVISGVSPSMLQINIDIKPGSGDDLAPINPKSRGKIPVALLSSSTFDATKVDVDSLTFGASGDENSLSRCNKGGEDVNDDGLLDLVCHFENQKAGFDSGSLEGVVRGHDDKGVVFEGRAFLKVVPGKKAE